MKAVAIAIMLALVPAFVFAQAGVTAECPEDECHVAPFFRGSGGFVGQFNEDAMADGEALTSVGLVVTCGNITTTASAEPADDGTVAYLFNDMNGLACYEDNGEFQIHGLLDGAWYWIHDDMNSAVSSLLPKSVLGNVQTPPFDVSGGGITMTEGTGGNATLVKDTASGRVGILPHILPAMEPDKCSDTVRTGCLLSGEYAVEIKNEAGESVPDGTTITRGAAAMDLTASIGGEGSIVADSEVRVRAEFYVNGPRGSRVPDQYGQGTSTSDDTNKPGLTRRPDDRVLEPGASSSLAQQAFTTLPIPAVTQETWDPCRSGNQQRDTPITVVVEIASTTNTIPGLGASDYRMATYNVACPPAASAARGVELVPENLFPVD